MIGENTSLRLAFFLSEAFGVHGFILVMDYRQYAARLCKTGWDVGLTGKKGEKYETKSFTTEVQLEFIMKDMFWNPPILEPDERFALSERRFPN